MARKRTPRQLTPLELEIMNVLWEAGAGTVQVVQERLQREPRLAYTSVQTMLNVLHRKGKVKRAFRGRAYEYAPVVSRKRVVRSALHDVIGRLFGGSAESLVMSLVETRHLKPETLARLSRLLAEPERKGLKEKTHGNLG